MSTRTLLGRVWIAHVSEDNVNSAKDILLFYIIHPTIPTPTTTTQWHRSIMKEAFVVAVNENKGQRVKALDNFGMVSLLTLGVCLYDGRCWYGLVWKLIEHIDNQIVNPSMLSQPELISLAIDIENCGCENLPISLIAHSSTLPSKLMSWWLDVMKSEYQLTISRNQDVMISYLQ